MSDIVFTVLSNHWPIGGWEFILLLNRYEEIPGTDMSEIYASGREYPFFHGICRDYLAAISGLPDLSGHPLKLRRNVSSQWVWLQSRRARVVFSSLLFLRFFFSMTTFFHNSKTSCFPFLLSSTQKGSNNRWAKINPNRGLSLGSISSQDQLGSFFV